MTTTLAPDFLRAVVLLTAWKTRPMERAQGALLYMALQRVEFSAYDIPGEITKGSKHLAGAAVGSLISLGLVEVVRREKSPAVNANGRKLDILRLASCKESTVREWLTRHDLPQPERPQMQLIA